MEESKSQQSNKQSRQQTSQQARNGRLAILFLIILAAILIVVVPCCNPPEQYYEPFNGPDLGDWEVSSPNVPGDWYWASSGTANGPFWGNRTPMQSESGGGAAIFNADSLNAGNTAGNRQTFLSYLTSPKIKAACGKEVLYLSFYQYYGKFQGSVQVEVYGDTDNNRWADSWVQLDDSQLVVGYSLDSMGVNQETDAGDRFVYDISDLAAGKQGVRVRFTFNGALYFWMIDDVRIGPEYSLPQFFDEPAVGPDNLSLRELLAAREIPAQSDGRGGYFPPNELVVLWDTINPSTQEPYTEAEKALVRDSFQLDTFYTCSCEKLLERWVIGDQEDDEDPTARDSLEGIGIQGLKDGATVDGRTMSDFNYFNVADATLAPNTDSIVYDPLAKAPGLKDPDATATVLAILDTGVDYYRHDLVRNIWRNDDIYCASPDDVIGWDFVDDDWDPRDLHPQGHGTLVSRVALQKLNETGVNFRIMPVRTHNADGLSSLFDVTCGTFYAIREGADVINMSWGWYGLPSSAFNVALYRAAQNGITITTVAGNSGLELSQDTMIYPAGYTAYENMLVVASYNELPATDPDMIPVRSPFSNWSDSIVDLAAPGESVFILGTNIPLSTEPFQMLQDSNRYITGVAMDMNGTSFAAPYVAALAVRARATGILNPWAKVLEAATKWDMEERMPQNEVRDGGYVKDGQPLDF